MSFTSIIVDQEFFAELQKRGLDAISAAAVCLDRPLYLRLKEALTGDPNLRFTVDNRNDLLRPTEYSALCEPPCAKLSPDSVLEDSTSKPKPWDSKHPKRARFQVQSKGKQRQS